MDFPKKQAQRLMPLYLLEYSEKLFTNHPNPEDPWGGGSDYTAGQGITITNNEIAVDTNVIATKSDIAQMVTTTQLNDALDDYALKTEIPTDVSQLYNDAGYATETWVQNQGYATSSQIPTNYVTLDTEQTITKSKTINAQLNFGDGAHNSILINADYANKPLISLYENTSGGEFSIGVADGTNTSSTGAYFTYEDDKGLREYRLPYQDREGLTTCTLATTDDYPIDDPQDQLFVSLTGEENTFYEKVDLSSAPGRMFYVNLSALNPIFKDGLISTYNEATNQLEVGLSAPIPDTTKMVTTDTNQEITGFKTFAPAKLSVERSAPIRMKLIFKPDMFMYYSENYVTNFNLPTSKPSGTADQPAEYTLATTDDIPSLSDYALKTEVPSTATSTSTSTVTPTTIELVFTYEDNTTQTITLMTGATVSTSTTTTLS